MKWGIIGYGSIGRRHAENIVSLGDSLVVLTGNELCVYDRANTIEDLLKNHKPEIILISNETYLHEKVYREIRSFTKTLPILIEKPLFDKKYLYKDDQYTFVAYCLRFHPLVVKIKKFLIDQKTISANLYVGQHLPTWRAGRDYTNTYSAKKELGGGVLRDLSHEIDLAAYLFGELSLGYCISKKVSDLEITSDDLFQGIFASKNGTNVVLEMNYLDRIAQRYLIIHTTSNTLKVDFIKSEVSINEKTEIFEVDKNEMYLKMLLMMKQQKYDDFTSFKEGLSVLEIISQVEEMQKL